MTDPAIRRAAARWVAMSLIIGVMTPLTPGLAADNPPSETETGAGQGPTFDDLLHRAERQIGEGHVAGPREDNALETWSEVLQLQSAAPTSPDVRKSLTEFVVTARVRAAEEKTAGHLPISIDFTVFADLATQLLGQVADANPPQMPPHDTPPPVAATPAAPEPQAAVAEPPAAPPPEAKTPEAKPAETKAVDTAAHNAAPPPAPEPAKPDVQVPPDPAMAAFYLRRGDELLAKKDISGARKFYEFAANAGNARAALTLARTHEAAFLAGLGVFGLKADPASARVWYSRAAALGDQEAAAKLQALGTAAAK